MSAIELPSANDNVAVDPGWVDNNVVKFDRCPWLRGEGSAAALDLRGAGDLADGADGIIRARRRACRE